MAFIIDAGFNILPVVKIETLGFNGPEAIMGGLHNFLNLADMFYINDDVIQKTIELRKSQKIKLGDTIIAATALVNNFGLITHNTSDFENIQGIDVIDLYTL